MRLSLCLEMLFTGRPFIDRMKAAADLGYSVIEFWDWRDKNLDELKSAAEDLGLTISAFSGNRLWSMINPEHRTPLLDELKQSLDVAGRLNCRHLMLLADTLLEDGRAAAVAGRLSDQDKRAALEDSLHAVAELAAGAGVVFCLEPLNTKLDHPGCFLDRSPAGFEMVGRVNSPGVRLLYDIYHMSMMGEDAAAQIEKNLPLVGYLHVADMPGRHEPGTGVIDYAALASMLGRLKYQGLIGMEFSPSGASEQAARSALSCFGGSHGPSPLC